MDPLTFLSVAQAVRGESGKQGVLGMISMIGVKNLLALVGLLVVGFGVAGWYLGWYQFGTQDDAQGHHQLKLQVDSSKVTQDLNKGREKIVEAIDKETGTVPPAPPPTSQPPAPPQPSQPPAPVVTTTLSVGPPPKPPMLLPPVPHGPQAPPPAPQPKAVDSFTLWP
jgi:hypothetical protein